MDEKLQIKKAIVHILNQKVSLVLSNATLELDEDILKLISDYIKNAYENQGRVFAKFKTEGNAVRKFAIDILKDDANFKVQNIVLDNGTEQTAVVMKIATYAEAYRRYLATYIHGILEAVNGLIDYCELEMVHIGNDGKETGIITLILQ